MPARPYQERIGPHLLEERSRAKSKPALYCMGAFHQSGGLGHLLVVVREAPSRHPLATLSFKTRSRYLPIV